MYEVQIDNGITLDTEGQVTLIIEQRRSMPPDPIYSMPACLASLLPVLSESPCLQTAASVVLRGVRWAQEMGREVLGKRCMQGRPVGGGWDGEAPPLIISVDLGGATGWSR